MGLIGAAQPGHEDRADHVIAQLGDGEHTRGAMEHPPGDSPQRLTGHPRGQPDVDGMKGRCTVQRLAVPGPLLRYSWR
jgi:hypothetical protein